MLFSNLASLFKKGVMYGFYELKIAELSESKNQGFFESVALAILPLSPSLQTFSTTSSTLWERLLHK